MKLFAIFVVIKEEIMETNNQVNTKSIEARIAKAQQMLMSAKG